MVPIRRRQPAHQFTEQEYHQLMAALRQNAAGSAAAASAEQAIAKQHTEFLTQVNGVMEQLAGQVAQVIAAVGRIEGPVVDQILTASHQLGEQLTAALAALNPPPGEQSENKSPAAPHRPRSSRAAQTGSAQQ